MSLLKSIHEIDTRQNPTLTVFDGSGDDESKLAKQFWSSVILMPPVESTLTCKEIKQRAQTRSLNDGNNKPRYTTAMSKAMQEKAMRDKEYDEIAVLKEADDQGKRLQAARERQLQVRQLFYKQATTNRIKNQEWAMPPINNYPMNTNQHGTGMYYGEEIDNEYNNDDNDRQLVYSLPD
ncbi:unnamed protein product [Adineta steineri]|uniref:Cilia- and flagella-associated protein HOATZ n=1 Tax=Adineta steineri TaxID=433720 RepID=A0A819EPP3_9BILA|nr:unnamed protein product [Adineta steineri]CAF1035428.1 unnamed protein product [Adineta steineri]CAF1176078.1 unnamed protein product [Adineta steineri]CAF1229513.1 unnamed protein product [Adineta steineri]CAF1355327.1 unnamed protein product [Adineta steineri]